MMTLDAFRLGLAGFLLSQADKRRRSFAGSPTGEDIKIIALLEHLADDARNIDKNKFLIYKEISPHKSLARRFMLRRDELLGQIGVLYCPASVTELLRWLCWQIAGSAAETLPVDDAPGGPFAVACRLAQAATTADNVPGEAGKGAGGFASFTNDFTAAFGIVGPFLSVWEVSVGIGQWHDQAILAAHPAVPAHILSAEPIGGGRSSGTAMNIVIAFNPSSDTGTCQVPMRVNALPVRPEPGRVLMVSPRSGNCEPPLVAAAVGDPVLTFSLAAFFMVASIVSMQVWSRGWAATKSTPNSASTDLTPLMRTSLASDRSS